LLEFRPPLDSPALIGFTKMLMPLILKYHLKGLKVEIVSDGLQRFKALQGKRVVICPNHPNHHDPEVMFAFSGMVDESFNFLAAREIFDYNNGRNGWCLQRVGVYSVVRGAVDRESFKMTKSLIAAGKKKLVIYPEGEISRQNDTLMPLEQGVAQMAFWALDEVHKTMPEETVYLLPIGVKYTYRENIKGAIEESLTKLEEHMGVKRAPEVVSPYARLRGVAEKLLSSLEKEYDHKSAKDASFNERIDSLRSFILKTIANFMQLQLSEKDTQLDWIRVVRNALDDFIYADDDDLSDYERKIHDEKASKIRGFYRDLNRVVNFIAIYDGYLRDHLTQERFSDVLDRFESEVFGSSSIKGARTVMIDVGRPISLLEHYADYKMNKRGTIAAVNEDMSAQISTMLETLELKRQRIYVD
jgi:1-acyl-sn-glycerol-3-phosphate acyltransferase